MNMFVQSNSNKNLSTNPKVSIIEQDGFFKASYVSDYSDAVDSQFYDVNELNQIKYEQKKTSWFDFLLTWVTNNIFQVVLVGLAMAFVFSPSLQTGILGWFGQNVLGAALNFVLYTTESGQSITVAMALAYFYIGKFLLLEVFSWPHQFQQQRENEILEAQQEQIRRIEEFRITKKNALQRYQDMQEWGIKALERQFILNKKTNDLLSNNGYLSEGDVAKPGNLLFKILHEQQITEKGIFDLGNHSVVINGKRKKPTI